MNVVVCVKQVFDPEAPARSFGVGPDGKTVTAARGVSQVIGAYDESALEAGLQIRDQQGGKVTLLSFGPPSATQFLKDNLASGADEAILVASEEHSGCDSFATGHILARAIRRMGEYDLVLCGREGSDSDAGIVGPCIAEDLGLPCATLARRVETASNGTLRVERAIDSGFQVIEVPRPAVVTVTSELYQIRYATLPTIMAADEKEVAVWRLSDLFEGGEQASLDGSATSLKRLFVPIRATQCQVFEAVTLEAAVGDLLAALRGKGLV